MFEPSLFRTIEDFALRVQSAPDAALDRNWAWGAYQGEGVRFAFFRTYEELREMAARISAERRSTEQPISTAQIILGQYHQAYRDLQASMLGLSVEQANQPPAEGEWAPRQVLSHILSADIGFYGVVRYALDRLRSPEGRPALIPDEAWEPMIGIPEAEYEALLKSPLENMRSFHDRFHARILEEFAGIDDAELEAPSMYWEGTSFSLRFRLHRFDSHMRQHTIQMDKTTLALGHAPNEARRLLRLMYNALGEAEAATLGASDLYNQRICPEVENLSQLTTEIIRVLQA